MYKFPLGLLIQVSIQYMAYFYSTLIKYLPI